jgi:DnaJ homolog subfamily C member 3
LSYYKRALSFLGMHRHNAALSDLTSVLSIQPDFSAALVQRGKILSWQGDFENAIKDLKKAKTQNELVLAWQKGG